MLRPFCRLFLLLYAVYALASPSGVGGADGSPCYGAVDTWTAAYPVSASLVSQMIYQESSGDPTAYNPSGASGCAQFMPATFWAWRQILNDDPTYAPGLAAARVFDPDYGTYWTPISAVHVLVYMLWRGQGCQWTTYARITGNCPGWTYTD